MPVISRFYGIVIAMYHHEHGVPHIHASYGGYEASIEIRTGRLHGELPPRIRRVVGEWLVRRRPELLDNWNRARSRRPLQAVAPQE